MEDKLFVTFLLSVKSETKQKQDWTAKPNVLDLKPSPSGDDDREVDLMKELIGS